MSFISNTLIKSDEAKQLGKLFQEMDVNKDGKVSKQEFLDSMEHEKAANEFLSSELTPEELFDEIDTDKSQFIEYSEFITAGLELSL